MELFSLRSNVASWKHHKIIDFDGWVRAMNPWLRKQELSISSFLIPVLLR